MKAKKAAKSEVKALLIEQKPAIGEGKAASADLKSVKNEPKVPKY